MQQSTYTMVAYTLFEFLKTIIQTPMSFKHINTIRHYSYLEFLSANLFIHTSKYLLPSSILLQWVSQTLFLIASKCSPFPFSSLLGSPQTLSLGFLQPLLSLWAFNPSLLHSLQYSLLGSPQPSTLRFLQNLSS